MFTVSNKIQQGQKVIPIANLAPISPIGASFSGRLVLNHIWQYLGKGIGVFSLLSDFLAPSSTMKTSIEEENFLENSRLFLFVLKAKHLVFSTMESYHLGLLLT